MQAIGITCGTNYFFSNIGFGEICRFFGNLQEFGCLRFDFIHKFLHDVWGVLKLILRDHGK